MTAVERTLEHCDGPIVADGKPTCRREVKPADAADGPLATCDDGLSCSVGEVCKASACGGGDAAACKCKADAECQDDGDLCNGTPYCDKGGPIWACKVNPATIVACDASTDSGCLQTSCVAKTGACLKAEAAPGTACSDGVACTIGDVCEAGSKCTPGTWSCCKSDADCAKEEDGDACNGTLFCDKAAGACKLNPATVVTCPSVQDTACAKASCDPKTGGCAKSPVGGGKACDDGDVCTDGEVCAGGDCKGGTDTCGCASDADCAGKDDGDLCNGVLYCNKAIGKCKLNPATAVTCQTVDDAACKQAQCQKKTGACAMVDLPAKVTCDADGTGCTANDACDGKGACAPGTAVCVCGADSDCAAFEDGDLCNGTLYCDKSGPSPQCKVNPKSLKVCPSVDDTACQKNRCQPKTGLCAVTALAAGAVCDDGQPCTGGDACDGQGACAPGKSALCGCKAAVDCAAFDDGDLCNGAFACTSGACAPTPKVTDCNDGNSCTDDTCVKSKGCVQLPNAATCSDGDGCTTGDACKLGGCAGAALSCDDKNPCTDDSCDAKSGCVSLPNSASCTDNSVCLLGETCGGGVCQKPLKGLDCSDGNSCTDDTCDDAKGCQHPANNKPCSDGDACTTGETCKDSACDGKGGKAIACGDSNSCTVDLCDATKGCVYTLVADGATCSELQGGACLSGTCEAVSCGLGLGAVVVDVDVDVAGQTALACEAMGPVWGRRPVSPSNVYGFGADVGGQKVVIDSQTGLAWGPSAGLTKTKSAAASHCSTQVFAGKAD